jgi:peptide/nickel transport system permease protein
MARSAKVNALKVLAYTIAIGIFFMIASLISIGSNRYIAPSGMETLFALPIGVAGTTLGILYLIAKKDPVTQRRLALGMLIVNLIVILGCPAILITLDMLTISETASFDPLSLLTRCFIAGIVGYILSILFMFSLVELIGKSRIERISRAIGEARTEKWRISWSHAREIWKEYSKSRLGMIALAIIVIISIVSIVGPYLIQEDPFVPKPFESQLPQPPSSEYWFGTDSRDKDIWSQMLVGGMPSLIVSFVSGAISIILGSVIGLVAGYYGKWPDEILMRITDFFLVIPWFPLMIVLVAILGRGFIIIIIVIGILSWPDTARLIRAQVLAAKESKYIERARAIGANDFWIIRKHILPQTFPLTIVCGVMIMAGAIFSESYLEFFGLGDPNTCSWGMILEKAESGNAMVNLYWWWVVPPSFAIIALIMGFYIIGDTLDDVLNPRLKKR